MFLHKWVFTNKRYGVDLDDHIRKVISDCGVDLDCPCDACPEVGPTVTALHQSAIETLAAQVAQLQARIDELEGGHQTGI